LLQMTAEEATVVEQPVASAGARTRVPVDDAAPGIDGTASQNQAQAQQVGTLLTISPPAHQFQSARVLHQGSASMNYAAA
jgi:hypothetical protein